MRGRLRAGALVALALGAAGGAGSVPGLEGGCAVPAASAAGTAGCCHYNKGVCGCDAGRARCCDGRVSASCRCGSGLTTRQISFDTRPLVSLVDFAFAGRETPEPPSPRLNLFRLGVDPLWFWFRVDCGDECWSLLAVDDALPLEVRWLFDPGSGPVLEGPPQPVALRRNRTAAFVTRPSGQLRQGRWETEVRFDTERLCLRGDARCWFRIEVRR
ncbi:MAG TPA: hypothetical protein VFV05_23795 [Methylomirabilota bacterium]|nr:hypothetical protein [Methylomirabilota bacterium]